MVPLTGVAGGLLAGWHGSFWGGSQVVILLAVFICGLTAADLVWGIWKWKKHPRQIEQEARLSALNDYEGFHRVNRDFDEMKKLGRPTFRVISRYVAVCFWLNLMRVGVASLVTFGIKLLIK
jgi:hypothetical protein